MVYIAMAMAMACTIKEVRSDYGFSF
jgi:hypothetical protein